jgi:hypothetical protein
MIDYFALVVGHGLLAFAIWRLVVRADVDEDPLLQQIQTRDADNRRHASAAGRNKQRRSEQRDDREPSTKSEPR